MRVIIVGGGLSGLVAAYRLQTDMPDLEVTVLEANSFPGGRMYTTAFGAEGGGESIGFYYSSFHQIAKDVGVQIDYASMTVLSKLFNIAYYWKDTNEWIEQKDLAKWPNNPLPPEYRDIPPLMLLRRLTSHLPKIDLNNPLDNPVVRNLANKTLLDYLEEQNFPKKAIPLLETNFEIIDMPRASAFHALIKMWIASESSNVTRYYFVKGGNQRLAIAIANKLKDIRYNQKVNSVKQTAQGHLVTTTDGHSYLADYVVFTVPAIPMRQIALDPPLKDLQKEALDAVEYAPAIKIFFKVNAPFWEKDGLPLFMWTNTEIDMVIPVYDVETRDSPLSGPKLWGVYAIVNGLKAQHLYDLEKQGIVISDHVQKLLEKIRPSMKGCLEYVETVDWGHIETAQGAFNYYLPSEKIPDYYRHINKPTLNRHFAGDYTEYLYKGFDAAVQSGLRVAREICEAKVKGTFT